MQRFDAEHRARRDLIIRHYLNGLDAGRIAGLTNLSRFNIQKEIDLITAQDPLLLARHLRARYRRQRRKLRYPSATILFDPQEATRSRNEY